MTTKKDEKVETKKTTVKETAKKVESKVKAGVNETVIAALEKLNLRELNDLVKNLEEHFDIKASAPMMMAAAPAGGEAAADGPSEVKVILTGVGPSKLAIIKAVGPIIGVTSLMEAKKRVEALPTTLKEKISPEEAEKIKKELTDLGAEVKVE